MKNKFLLSILSSTVFFNACILETKKVVQENQKQDLVPGEGDNKNNEINQENEHEKKENKNFFKKYLNTKFKIYKYGRFLTPYILACVMAALTSKSYEENIQLLVPREIKFCLYSGVTYTLFVNFKHNKTKKSHIHNYLIGSIVPFSLIATYKISYISKFWKSKIIRDYILRPFYKIITSEYISWDEYVGLALLSPVSILIYNILFLDFNI